MEQRAIPDPGHDQVLIKVKAFGLNRSELMTRKGLSPMVSFPRVLGIECVGEVVHDPSGELYLGQKVAALMGGMGREYDGSYQEFTVLPKDIIIPFESSLDWITLGAIPEMFHTVNGSLHLALKIKSLESILIRGGTSSIGMLAIQIAKKSGLQVWATTRNVSNENLLLQAGADHVLIDNGTVSRELKKQFSEGVDKVLELVGTSTLHDSLQCARPGGTVCLSGMLSEQWSMGDFCTYGIYSGSGISYYI